MVQAAIGWTGFVIATIWMQHNMPNHAGSSPAYPVGDKNVIASGLVDADSYDPIPNAIFFNWVTFIVLAFGNCMALDFNACELFFVFVFLLCFCCLCIICS